MLEDKPSVSILQPPSQVIQYHMQRYDKHYNNASLWDLVLRA
jgi:hypothetical protein